MDKVYRCKGNTTDLLLAIKWGCRCIQSILDPDHDNLPYFRNNVLAERPYMGLERSVTLGHMPGRSLKRM